MSSPGNGLEVHLRIGRLVVDAGVMESRPDGLRRFEAALALALEQQLSPSAWNEARQHRDANLAGRIASAVGPLIAPASTHHRRTRE